MAPSTAAKTLPHACKKKTSSPRCWRRSRCSWEKEKSALKRSRRLKSFNHKDTHSTRKARSGQAPEHKGVFLTSYCGSIHFFTSFHLAFPEALPQLFA